MSDVIDCAVIGGGPAGLTAAIYLARFRRSVTVFDAGKSRAAWIPVSHNYAGFPEGINGVDLLDRMRAQAVQYGAIVRDGCVTTVERDDDGLTLIVGDGKVRARAVLFATGVVNLRPPLDDETHAIALSDGLLRYCPVCDGFEAIDQRIAVLGADSHGLEEALFLRTFSDRIRLLTLSSIELTVEDHAKLDAANIVCEPTPISAFDFSQGAVRVTLSDGSSLSFDTLYPALGSSPNSELLATFGLLLAGDACAATDKHQRLGVSGLYAAGDVAAGLDQISVAMGQAAVAATAIHNDLRRSEVQAF